MMQNSVFPSANADPLYQLLFSKTNGHTVLTSEDVPAGMSVFVRVFACYRLWVVYCKKYTDSTKNQ